MPTSASFVRLGVGPALPPPGLEKQSDATYFKIHSPATSNDPSSSSRTPSRSAKSTPPPSAGLAYLSQITPPPMTCVDQPFTMFQGNDPAGWYAMVQAQWQVCEAYKLAGQVQLEAQQREYAMLLQH